LARTSFGSQPRECGTATLKKNRCSTNGYAAPTRDVHHYG
jgi:hypothetical protein